MVMAAVNVFFLILLLRWPALGVIVAIAAVHLILQYAGSRRRGLVVIGVLGITVTTLFLIHKLPVVAANVVEAADEGASLWNIIAIVCFAVVLFAGFELVAKTPPTES